MPDDEAIQQAAGQLPIVLAGTRDPKVPGTDIVVNDDRAGARAATEHLLRLGHTRIGHLSGPDAIGALRLAGFQEAMRTAGLDADAYHEPAGTSEEVGYAVARRLLTLQDRPTALLAFNDMTAIGALSAAYDLGLSVPEDLSLIGYDNTFVARIRHISLTSVDNGSFAVGAQAGRFLLERLTAPTLPQRIHQVPAELQVRGSTSTPR